MSLKISEATVHGGGGIYFGPGTYKVEIQALKEQKSSKNPGKVFAIVETRVLESSNEEIPKGAMVSQVIDMTQLMGPVNLKIFVAAASGVDPTADNVNELVAANWRQLTGVDDMDIDDVTEFMASEDNPLQGLEMNLVCVNIKTKSGGDFTKHNWQPIDFDAFAE